jgi:hypothetical protein
MTFKKLKNKQMKKIIYAFIMVISWIAVNAQDTIIFDLSKITRTTDYIEFPISVASEDEVNSLDFAMYLLDIGFSDMTVVKHKSYLMGSSNTDSNKLSFTGYSFSEPIEKNTPIASVRVYDPTKDFTVNNMKVTLHLINANTSDRKIITYFCMGDSISLIAPGDTNACYLWSAGYSTKSIKVGTEGNYVSYTLSSDCSNLEFTSSIISLKSATPPIASFTADGPVEFCQDADSVSLTALDGNGYNYLWSNGDTAQSITADSAGIYFVEITDSNRCSDISDSIQIEVFPLPDETVYLNGPTNFCNGDSVIITAAYQGEGSYLWSTTDTTNSLTVNTGGSFFLEITDTNGCKAFSDTIETTLLPLPDVFIDAEGPTTFCPGDSVVLTAVSDSTVFYIWNTSETSQSINVHNSGDYTVEVTDTNGCSKMSETETVSAEYLPADINTDNFVNASDYNNIVGLFGQSCSNCPEDIDNDGYVNATDYNYVVGTFGSSCN